MIRTPWLPFAFLLSLAGLGEAQIAIDVGEPVFGTDAYVEYVPGNLPIVLSVPHGGHLRPSHIADRTYGVTGRDTRTIETARHLHREIVRRTGRFPHLVVCHLHRSKLDANRDIVEAAQGDPIAERTWREYHDFLERAKASVTARYGEGHVFDIHGHGHPETWVELGYLLNAQDLAQGNAHLNDPATIARSSLRALATHGPRSHAELIRGPLSLGARLEASSFPSVPSPANPDPAGGNYFNGGYITARHGSRDSGTVDATQFELPWSARSSERERLAFARAFANAVLAFFADQRGMDLETAPRVFLRSVDPIAREGQDTASFVVQRGGDLSQPSTVELAYEGTATVGQDYFALPRTLTFLPHEEQRSLTVLALPDALAEGTESVVVRLRGGVEISSPHRVALLVQDGAPAAAERLALWRFEESAGTTLLDDSPGARHGTLHPSPSNGPLRVDARIGRGLRFDGIDDHARLPDVPFDASSGFSLGFWFRAPTSSGSGFQYLLSHGAAATPNSLNVYLVEATGHLRTSFAMANGLTELPLLDVEEDLMDDRWHHYLLTCEPMGLTRIYVDGEERRAISFADDRFDPVAEVFLGMRSDLSPTRGFEGWIDEVACWDHALVAEEVALEFELRPGGARAFGLPCGSGRHAVEGHPQIGERFVHVLEGAGAGSLAVLLLGVSNVTWQGLPLPIDLTFLGAPGCRLSTDPTFSIPTSTNTMGQARVSLALPIDPSLLGGVYYAQFAWSAPGANALDWLFTEAQEIGIGGIL